METSDSQHRSQYFTVQDIAKMLKISGQTVARRFQNVPGVVNVGDDSLGKKRRHSRSLRIPSAVLARFLFERRVK